MPRWKFHGVFFFQKNISVAQDSITWHVWDDIGLLGCEYMSGITLDSGAKVSAYYPPPPSPSFIPRINSSLHWQTFMRRTWYNQCYVIKHNILLLADGCPWTDDPMAANVPVVEGVDDPVVADVPVVAGVDVLMSAEDPVDAEFRRL